MSPKRSTPVRGPKQSVPVEQTSPPLASVPSQADVQVLFKQVPKKIPAEHSYAALSAPVQKEPGGAEPR